MWLKVSNESFFGGEWGCILISSHREEELQALWLSVNNPHLASVKDNSITNDREPKQLHYNRKGVAEKATPLLFEVV